MIRIPQGFALPGFDGEKVSAPQAVRLFFASNLKEVGRLRWVMGIWRKRRDPQAPCEMLDTDEGGIKIDSLIATVVQISNSSADSQAAMVICRVHRCDPGNVPEIAAADADSDDHSVTVRVMLLKAHADGYEWSSRSESGSRRHAYATQTIQLAVSGAIPFTPSKVTVQHNVDGLNGVQYVFKQRSLQAVADVLDPTTRKTKFSTLPKLAVVGGGKLPYCALNGAPSFVWNEPKQKKAPKKKAQPTKKKEKEKSPKAQQQQKKQQKKGNGKGNKR